jgi:hypothetical protein
MNFIEKLRQKPEKEKRIILWFTVCAVGIIMVFFWFNSILKGVSRLKSNELENGIKTEAIKKEINNFQDATKETENKLENQNEK